MHPDAIRALARQHQAELLRRQHFRERPVALAAERADRVAGPMRHLRHGLGRALVVAGTRLLAPSPVPGD